MKTPRNLHRLHWRARAIDGLLESRPVSVEAGGLTVSTVQVVGNGVPHMMVQLLDEGRGYKYTLGAEVARQLAFLLEQAAALT